MDIINMLDAIQLPKPLCVCVCVCVLESLGDKRHFSCKNGEKSKVSKLLELLFWN
jgi:hypothetical protein